MPRKACKCSIKELHHGCFTGKFPKMFGDYFYEVLTFLNATATTASKPSHAFSSSNSDFATLEIRNNLIIKKKKFGLSV